MTHTTKTLTKEEVAQTLKSEIANAWETLAKWKETLNHNPSYAMVWSQKAFDASAVLEVCIPWSVGLEKNPNFTVEQMLEEMKHEVLRKAQSPERSTSVPSNLMERAVLAYTADLIRVIEKRF